MQNIVLPVVKGPSGMKNAPIVIAVAAANLKNQNLRRNQKEHVIRSINVWLLLWLSVTLYQSLNVINLNMDTDLIISIWGTSPFISLCLVVHVPIMHSRSWILAALNLDHEEREQEEEHGHAEAYAVHGLVTHQHVTVHMTLYAWDRGSHPSLTKAWNLWKHIKCSIFSIIN